MIIERDCLWANVLLHSLLGHIHSFVYPIIVLITIAGKEENQIKIHEQKQVQLIFIFCHCIVESEYKEVIAL